MVQYNIKYCQINCRRKNVCRHRLNFTSVNKSKVLFHLDRENMDVKLVVILVSFTLVYFIVLSSR